MSAIVKRLLRYTAFRHGRFLKLYRRVCRPDGRELAAFMKLRQTLHAIGDHCSIQTNVQITDPKYVSLGNNVRLSGCTLFGHDGSVNMINRAFGLKLDRVGKIVIHDDVFIGHGAVVLPGVTIGPRSIVGAGAVVSSDVAADSVYGGVPARRLCGIQELVATMTADHAAYPWKSLVESRPGDYDPAMQAELDRRRVRHFFGHSPKQPRARPAVHWPPAPSSIITQW